MQDVMYGRFENLPSTFLSNAVVEEDDENGEDEDVVDICCPNKCAFEEDVTFLRNDDENSARKMIARRRICSPLVKILIASTTAIALFVIAYNFILSSSPNPFEQNSLPAASAINSSKANSLLTYVCDGVAKQQLTGDICHWLCAKSRNYTVTGFYDGGSKMVLKLNLMGKDLILKTRHAHLHEYDMIDERVDDTEFTDKVLEIVNDQLRMDWPYRYKNHLIRSLWPSYKETQTLTHAERQSLWTLLQQDEFVEMKTLPLTRVTPKILGSCGQLYQVEYMIPFKMKAYYMNLKAKILVHLMGTLKLFYEFLNEPLQWCDVKFENLGLSAEYPRRFMVLDADMLYTDSKLNQILTSQACKNDSECNHFDCHSVCNNSTGFCTSRTNDNVDVFCEKLINRLFGTFWSKANKYLAACHDKTVSAEQRLTNLRYIWAWSFVNV